MDEVPMFWLEQIGGMNGLKRWLELCHEHSRLVKPVVNYLRRGIASPELRLMESAAAMDTGALQ